MTESNSDSDSNIDLDVSEPYSEREKTPDESLEAVEENSSEFDLELTDAITEVKY